MCMKTMDIIDLIRTTMAREGALPLNQQLRSVLEMAAAAGELPPGLQLPSVRTLARELGLAPNTVVRAYKELEAEGIVRVAPRRAYYVSGGPKAFASPAHREVQGLLDEALRAAEDAGLDTVQFLQLASKLIRARRQRTQRIAVVGDRDAALELRVAAVRRALADLPVDVIPLSFEDLATAEGSAMASGVDSYIVPMLDTERAALLLGPHAHRILPMYLSLSPEVRAFISSRPAGTKFGIIVSREAYRARLVTAVRRLHTDARISAASVDDRRAVAGVIDGADVVLVSSPSVPRMPKGVALPKAAVEMTFLPDEETIRRLRTLLGADSRKRVRRSVL